tara:strand:+ start:5845 stop:6012 length:168 start_codon:yes stop_codon:yes gene_type:complete
MNNKGKIKVGDLCLYHNIPVIVLKKDYSRWDSIIDCLCLFYSGIDTVAESDLIKI